MASRDEGGGRAHENRSSNRFLSALHGESISNTLDRCQEALQRQKKPRVWEKSAKQDLPNFLCVMDMRAG